MGQRGETSKPAPASKGEDIGALAQLQQSPLFAALLNAEPVAKLASLDADGRTVDGSMPNLLGVIRSGETRLVVNTPTPRSGPIRDAAEIRHAAIAEGVPCLTAIETAVAAAEALDPDIASMVSEVRSLDEWLRSTRVRPGGVLLLAGATT